MKKEWMKSLAVLSVLMSIVLLAASSYAQMVKIKIYPQAQEITIYKGGVPAPKQIALTTEVESLDMRFEWSLKGPGELKGDTTNPGVLYSPPAQLSDASGAQAAITVEVIDQEGKKMTDSVSFTLIPGELPAPLSPKIGALSVKEKDTIMNPTYNVKPGATLTIAADITRPADRQITLDGSAIVGAIKLDAKNDRISYTAPKDTEELDMVTLKLVDAATNEVVFQQLILMNVSEAQQ